MGFFKTCKFLYNLLEESPEGCTALTEGSKPTEEAIGFRKQELHVGKGEGPSQEDSCLLARGE